MCEHARSMNELGSGVPVPVGFHYPVFSKLRELLTTLQREIKPPGEHDRDHIAQISSLLQQTPVQKEEWSQFVHFMENRYTRHLVAHDENFTVLLLCWNNKQRSPIHDHAGSSCWVRVMEGTITERRFMAQPDGGGLTEIGKADVGPGGVCYINDTQGLHEMANEQDDAPCVTLHVYSPPYYHCNAFSLDGSKRQVSMLAAAAPPRQAVGSINHAELLRAQRASAQHPESSISLVTFADILDDSDKALDRILPLYDSVWLSPAEWATYAHFSEFRFQRLLIHQNDRFSLLLLCWLPGQETPPHTHNGSSSWVRVLHGTLTFTEDPLGEKKVTHLSSGSATFAEDSNLPLHTMGNHSEEYAVSLHLYNPPYTELHYGANAACPCAVFPHCRGTVTSHECLPVVQCQRLGKGSRSSSANTTPLSSNTQPQFVESPIFTNLTRLVDRFECIFANAQLLEDREALSVAVMDILEATPLSGGDIDKYWVTKKLNGSRIRLFENTKFNITLNLWEPGHRSVAHDHDGSMSWVKVIEGSLVDIAYEASAGADGQGSRIQVSRNSTMVSGDVVFYSPSSIHALRNKSTLKRAATLHVYFGVCSSCRWFADKPVKVSSQTTLSDEWHIFKASRASTPEPTLVQTLKEAAIAVGDHSHLPTEQSS